MQKTAVLEESPASMADESSHVNLESEADESSSSSEPEVRRSERPKRRPHRFTYEEIGIPSVIR